MNSQGTPVEQARGASIASKVLVVDDDRGLGQVICRRLAGEGVEAHAVTSGDACLSFLAHDRVDMVLVNFELSDMNAEQLVAALRLQDHLPPYVVMTDYGNRKVAVDMVRLGAHDCVLEEGSFIDGLARLVKKEQEKTADDSTPSTGERQIRNAGDSWPTTSVAAGDIVCLVSPDRRILSINKAGCEAAGMSIEEIVGRHCCEVIPRRNTPIPSCPCAEALHTGKACSADWKEDGRSYDLSAWPVRNESGTVTKIVLTVRRRDAEARKTTEKRTERLPQDPQAHEMESVGRLAGCIAHDFNNILGGIVGYADVLAMHLADHPHAQSLLKKITDAAARATALTARLLTLGRTDGLSMEQLDMNVLVQQATNCLRETLDRSIIIHTRPSSETILVDGDRNELFNALLNLGINARDAMPNGGTLSFELGTESLDADALQERGLSITPGRYVKLSVRDTGVGMTEEARRRVFEPLLTPNEKNRGHEQGLAGVYECAKRHDGFFDVESELGRGTSFHLFLPTRADAGPVGEAEVHQGTIGGRGRILLVDDEELIRESTREMLLDLGYSVTECVDGAQAVESFTACGGEVDAVMLDLIMPTMGGVECCRAIRKLSPSVPVIVITGFGNGKEETLIAREGIEGLLRKPYGKQQLSEVLAQAFARGTVTPPTEAEQDTHA